MKKLLPFLLAIGCAITANAQVVQPSYVRPAKGAPIVLAPAVTASSVVATYTTSAIFDWTAFAGVVVTAEASQVSGTYTACKYGVEVKALGGTSTTATFFPLNVANNDYVANISQSWYVRVLPGYLRFSIGTTQAYAPGQPSCTYRVTATPLPFDYAGQLLSTGIIKYYSESSTDDIVVSPTYPYVRLQNLSTSAAFCVPQINGSFNFTRPGFVLKADSTGNTGDGGVIEITNWVGVIRCSASVGQAVTGFAH